MPREFLLTIIRIKLFLRYIYTFIIFHDVSVFYVLYILSSLYLLGGMFVELAQCSNNLNQIETSPTCVCIHGLLTAEVMTFSFDSVDQTIICRRCVIEQ